VQHILSNQLLTTRRGTVMLGAASAVLAAVLLLVYLGQYRKSVSSGAAPITVLVAEKLISKGTSASVIGSDGLMQVLTIPRDQAKQGAVSDPVLLKGRVAVQDIYPGQQLTLADFTAVTTDAIPTKLVRDQRAIAVPFDSSHGMIGHIQAGDRVDVYVGLYNEAASAAGAVLKLLAENVYVLSAPGAAGGGIGGAAGNSSNFVFRVRGAEAAKIAWSADNGTLWIVLRPGNGAKAVRPGNITGQTILKSRPTPVEP
jgi:Flp pilus assembly protein CpaB